MYFLPNYANFDIDGEIIFSKNQSMKFDKAFVGPWCISTSEDHSPKFHGIHGINTFKTKVFFRMFFSLNFSTPKFMKIGYYFHILGSSVVASKLS